MKKLKESKYYNCCNCGNMDCPGKPNEGICNSKENNTGHIESMDRQSMIDKIYEKIADKTLSFGCNIFLGGQDIDICTGSCGDTHIFGNNYNTIDKGWIIKIIGHPVMIGDVLDWVETNIKKKHFRETNSVALLDRWDNRRDKIDEQSDECIQYVYELTLQSE